MDARKKAVQDFWDEASCGETLYLHGENYAEQARQRYELEPYIEEFADFAAANNKRVLEVGVGLGADHQKFAESGAELWGVDLTPRAIEHVQRRFRALGLHSHLAVGDAEKLAFRAEAFDLVYSWGVLHHSPDTPAAIDEVWRVLDRGGAAKIMVYHTHSLIGYMLWVRYALLRLRPWTTLTEIYSKYLESPGTKAYTVQEAAQMFSRFSVVDIRVHLTHGDLLESASGQRHGGFLLNIARKIWPRTLLKKWAHGYGLFMTIDAIK